MSPTLFASTFFRFLFSAATGGSVTFDPPEVVVTPQSDPVTVSVSVNTELELVDPRVDDGWIIAGLAVRLRSADPHVQFSEWEYLGPVSKFCTFPPCHPEAFSSSQLDEFSNAPLELPLLLGRLTIDVSSANPGSFEVRTDPTVSYVYYLDQLGQIYEPLSGTLVVTVVPEPTASTLVMTVGVWTFGWFQSCRRTGARKPT